MDPKEKQSFEDDWRIHWGSSGIRKKVKTRKSL